MLRLGFQEFATLVEHIDDKNSPHETENRRTLFAAIYKQVQNYKNRNSFRHPEGPEIKGEAEKVHRIFVLVALETGLNPRTRQREGEEDPVGRSLERYKQLRKGDGRGDWDFTIAIYYWFHRDDTRLPFAAQIDKAVFGQPFHVRFNLTRDEYTPLVRDERDFNIGPLLFSCNEEAANLATLSDPLGSILDAGQPSPAKALSWRYALTDLIGRNADMGALTEWAKASPGELSMRLLSGVGGSGKTRLASELVSRLNEQGQKWNAGFLGKDCDGVTTFFTPMDGVLLIIDYPEERMGFVQALIDGLRDRSQAHVSVRILLLSRLDETHWRHASTTLGHRFSVQSANATSALVVEDAHALVSQAFKKLVEITDTKIQLSDHAWKWLELDEKHRLPLFATAAAVHAFLMPNDAFGLNGPEILEALAEIEIDRVRAYSKNVGLGEFGLERLLALATFSQEGLNQSDIEILRDNGLPLDLQGQALIDALAKTPWWIAEDNTQDGVLEKLSPDRIAVTFLALTLMNAKISRLPEWLVFVMSPHGADVGAVVGRLLFDVSIHGERYRQALDQLMLGMLDADHGGVEAFQDAAYREHTSLSAPFAIKLISALVEQAETAREQARLLHNLATNLHNVGRYEEALDTYERCIALRRRRAFWPWSKNADKRALAISLGNYANCLSGAGQTLQADKVSREALKLRRRIAESATDEEHRGLAISLSNAADLRMAKGQTEEAIQLAAEAVAILEEIQKKERGSG
ncbi:MAG: tetratricopeptide repeat protein [Pseudomonadales bacterium]